MKEKSREKVRLIRITRYGERIVYEGPRRLAERRIPPSKKNQYRIEGKGE